MPGPLAYIKDVETEVQDHADDGRVVDERDEGPIRRGCELFESCNDGDERNQARDHLRRQDEDGVAQRSRTQSGGRDGSFRWLFDVCQFAAMLTPGHRTFI